MSSFNGLTDLEDLRVFLQERIAEVDPNLDTDLGSRFDTEVIQPLLFRLGPDPFSTPIRDFILSRLAIEVPDLVLQDGEPIDDLLVKPMQLLLEPYRRQIQRVAQSQSFANPESLSELEADNLAGNFFINRRVGGFAVGIARLYYTSPQFALATPSNVVSTTGGLRFLPIENQSITADDMIFNTEDNLFYFDIVVRSDQQGAAYNITANALNSIEGLTAVVKVSNPSAFEEGADSETTEDFVARVETSLSERSLVTTRGINARLTNAFENIRLIQVIGFGDLEMERDVLTGDSSSAPYAYLRVDMNTDTFVDLASGAPPVLFPDSGFSSDTNSIQVGDVLTHFEHTAGTVSTHVVQEIVSSTRVRVEPPTLYTLTDTFMVATRPGGTITLTDIPGGILEPTTPQGNIQIADGLIHIGGKHDVYVRPNSLQEQETTIEGARDGEPLHFGIDLEAFGSEQDRFTLVMKTPTLSAVFADQGRYNETVTDEVIVKQLVLGGPDIPLKVTEDDVGRYLRIGTEGTFKITEFVREEYLQDGNDYLRSVRLKIETSGGDPLDYESATAVTPSTSSTFTDLAVLAELNGIKNRLRDRDGSVVAVGSFLGGADLVALGAEIGDSIIIESGSDAGSYTIRRILSWLTPNDTIIADRDLTNTLEPSGSGNGTGLRYRIADELNIDLVNPRITKIPLGSIFSGDDLSVVAGSTTLSATGSTNFLLAGVEAGDTLEILSGSNPSTYEVITVASTTVVVDGAAATTEAGLTFTVFRAFTGINRPLVRVKDVELLNSSLGSTGISIPYGGVIDARINGALANREEGTVLESFTGDLIDNGGGFIVRLFDTNKDFVAEGIQVGQRVNIKTGRSIGQAYTIASIGTPSNNHLDVTLPANGGTEFVGAETGIRYSIGTASIGVARLYFLDPTSVTFQTGIGGSLLELGSDTDKKFRLSEVDGFANVEVLPTDALANRDLRVVSYDSAGPTTIVELTGDDRPGVYELEILVGDTLEVHEQIPFRTPGGSEFKSKGIFGAPAGLRTVTGSNRVSVPTSSLIDFTEMDAVTPLVGQILVINEGPDAGEYVIEEVIDARTLGLNKLMTSTTAPILGESPVTEKSFPTNQNDGITSGGSNFTDPNYVYTLDLSGVGNISVGDLLVLDDSVDKGIYGLREGNVVYNEGSFSGATGITYRILRSRDAYFVPGSGSADLYDPTDAAGLGSQIGHYITIIESSRPELDGTYEITALAPNSGVTLDIDVENINDELVLSWTPQLFGDENDQDAQDFGASFSTAGVAAGDWVYLPNFFGASSDYRIIITEVDTQTRLVVFYVPFNFSSRPYRIESMTRNNPFGMGRFNWFRTETDVNVQQKFTIYNAVPTKTTVTEVSTKVPDVRGIQLGDVTSSTVIEDPSEDFTLDTVKGDIVEVVAGPAAGQYFVDTPLNGSLVISSDPGNPFPATVSNAPYRVWSGLTGSRTMLTVSGQLNPGQGMPYKIRRSKALRVSSTDMEANVDNSLYYVDAQIESEGSGSELNLTDGERLVSGAGINVDGYTYIVENNSLTYSTFENVSLKLTRRFLPVGNTDSPENLTEITGSNLKFSYESSTTVRLINDLLRSDFERPVNADPIARHFLPSFVYTTLTYRSGVSPSQVGPEIEEYINTLGAEAEIEVSDLEAFLTRRGADSIRHPIELVTVTHDLDRKLVVDRSDDRLGGDNATSFNGTGRISSFFTTLDEELKVERES